MINGRFQKALAKAGSQASLSEQDAALRTTKHGDSSDCTYVHILA